MNAFPNAQPAIIAGDRHVTYGELRTSVAELAGEIRARTGALGRRARVGLSCPNGLEYILLALAILESGACLVPLAEELTDPEREEIVRITALDFILNGGAFAKAEFDLAAVRPAIPPAFPEDEFQALQPAFIRFSSGTTGTSKGVVLSHRSLHARIAAANRGLQLTPSDRVLWLLPMAHHFAVSIFLYLHAGAVTILPESTSREDILAAAEAHGATVLYGSPFHFAQLAADPGDFRWPGLRLPIATAAPLSAATADAFEKRFGRPIVQGLGIIEVGLSMLNLHSASAKPGALGRPLPDYEVELRDDQGHPVSDGTPGAFHVRGPGLLDAYLVPWQPRPLDDRGFFASGDLVVRDTEGDLTLVGRTKSVINVAGMKLFPEEVEAVLDLHPAVVRSRVFGRPHAEFGQIPVAEIIPADPSAPPVARDLQTHCKAHLSPHKVPFRFTCVESLPLTASGKIRRC